MMKSSVALHTDESKTETRLLIAFRDAVEKKTAQKNLGEDSHLSKKSKP